MTEATGQVVATAKSCAEMVEESGKYLTILPFYVKIIYIHKK